MPGSERGEGDKQNGKHAKSPSTSSSPSNIRKMSDIYDVHFVLCIILESERDDKCLFGILLSASDRV